MQKHLFLSYCFIVARKDNMVCFFTELICVHIIILNLWQSGRFVVNLVFLVLNLLIVWLGYRLQLNWILGSLTQERIRLETELRLNAASKTDRGHSTEVIYRGSDQDYLSRDKTRQAKQERSEVGANQQRVVSLQQLNIYILLYELRKLSTNLDAIVGRQTSDCAGELSFVNAEFKWSVFYSELTRQLSSSQVLKWNSHQKATKALFVIEYQSNLRVNA